MPLTRRYIFVHCRIQPFHDQSLLRITTVSFLGEDRFAGKSNWHPKWVDLEFDPVMEIDLKSDWKSFEDYSNALRKKIQNENKKDF